MDKTTPPSPDKIRDARKSAGMSCAEAGAMVYVTERSWQHWESGRYRMPPGLWELFQIKLQQRQGVA